MSDAEPCCALKPGHDGCCAYRCQWCDGSGHLGCFPDDLGCNCGGCDGWGYCPDCDGQGWFDDFGNTVIVFPEEVP